MLTNFNRLKLNELNTPLYTDIQIIIKHKPVPTIIMLSEL